MFAVLVWFYLLTFSIGVTVLFLAEAIFCRKLGKAFFIFMTLAVLFWCVLVEALPICLQLTKGGEQC